MKQYIKRLIQKIPFAWELLSILRGRRGTGIKEKFALAFDRRIRGTMKGGLIHIRMTTGCNCRCKFCGPACGTEKNPRVDIDRKILFEHCRPLYKRVACVFLTGGDPLIVKDTFPFCTFLSQEFPAVNLFVESNAIAFDERWQEFCVKNLVRTHFSVNASCEAEFIKNVWTEGGAAYRKAQENIASYQELLHNNNRDAFAPGTSMVINRDSKSDWYNFLLYALTGVTGGGFASCSFQFDYKETDMNTGEFRDPDMYGIYFQLLKLERMLEGYFKITSRFLPVNTRNKLYQIEADADKIPRADLRREYADVWALAKHRSIRGEYEQREQCRRQQGKKRIPFYQEQQLLWMYKRIGNHYVCHAPFDSLALYPSGRFDVCCRSRTRFTIDNAVQNGALDWEREFINHPLMLRWRRDVLRGNYSSVCPKMCPYQYPCKPASRYSPEHFSGGIDM